MQHVQSELQRQQSSYASVRGRLLNPPAVAKTVAKYEAQIEQVRAEFSAQKQQAKAIEGKLLARLKSEVRQHDKLKLDHADLQAAFIEQVKRLSELENALAGIDEQLDLEKRSVTLIVAEVLKDYPGVTWAEIRSVSRQRHLIEPRYACMRAIYDQRRDLSTPAIGRIFKRDHTSVLFALGRTKKNRARWHIEGTAE